MAIPIKILYIIDILDGDLGGTENQLKKLISSFNNGNFRTHLLCFDNPPWFQRNAAIFGCDTSVIDLNKFRSPATYINFLKLIKFIKDQQPDIVHTFFPVGNSIGVLAARLAGIKNIVSSRRDYGEWMSSHYLLATKFANRFVKKIVANSAQVEILTQSKEKVRNGKIEVIPNGINIAEFNAVERDLSLKKRLNIPQDDKVVGIIANFRPMKHHNIFLLAAREILKIRKDVSFILMGQGPLEKEVVEFGELLNIGRKLYFTGSQREVPRYLSIMDVGVNCSEQEGLSNAVMEYMAAGIPCIVSRAGGNPDLIAHEVDGYTFELDDYKDLADLTLRLLYDDAARKRFVRNARLKIEREMSLEAMVSNYDNLYRRVAGEPAL